MPYIDPKIVNEVKGIDLLPYLKEHEPEELVPLKDGEYCLRSHDSLKISHGLWHWFSRGIGGRSALDYLIKVEGMTFQDAVLKLADGSQHASINEINEKMESDKSQYLLPYRGVDGNGRVLASSKSYPNGNSERGVLLLPKPFQSNDRVYKYLTETRGIDAQVAEYFIQRGQIYEAEYAERSSGRRFANAVFLGPDKDGQPKQASIRGLFSSYKSEAAGSDKRYAFSLPYSEYTRSKDLRLSNTYSASPCLENQSAESAKRLHLFESAIDLMSYMSLMKRRGENPRDGHLLSLSGVYRPNTDPAKSRIPLAVTQFMEDYPGITEAVLHLDNDLAGRLAAEAFMKILPAARLSVTNEPPERGKDYNDWLRLTESNDIGRHIIYER